MLHHITVLPQQRNIQVSAGENLLHTLRQSRLLVQAPCGGKGRCGKCKVLVDGQERLACQTIVDRDMTVVLPEAQGQNILTDGIAIAAPVTPRNDGYALAFDIGTTTVVGYLLNGRKELASASTGNPQAAFGADVVSRIQHALRGQMDNLAVAIRKCVADLANRLCEKAAIAPGSVTVVSIVGNPAMQQLFLGLRPDNLAQIPFSPVLTQAKSVSAEAYLPNLKNAELLIVPNISGFVGADTVACILATELYQKEELTLLVDIGTNGEMVLGNQHRMVACSAAAGPALEGANIQFGMGGRVGAIDHVHMENGQFSCSVIGGGEAVGICGSGIIDAVAVALDMGLLNKRGKLLTEDNCIHLTEDIYLTQEDIRQIQLAKGAIAAGIELMAAHLGVTLQDIQTVYLAGAFGTFMDPASACRIGLLPAALERKIAVVGNAAGSGAKMLVCDMQKAAVAQELVNQTEFLELASVPEFQRCFARNMRFFTVESYWCQKAIALGFSHAVALDIATLQPRADVRDMCAADKCGAYEKNWTCPPYCGTLAECSAKMGSYTHGILLQTVGITEKLIDTKAYRRTEALHLEQFHALCEQLRATYPEALCLGSGGCRICKKCAHPDACRFPEKACSSMEGYGLFVTEVCRNNGLAYHHGERTVTYTACVLF